MGEWREEMERPYEIWEREKGATAAVIRDRWYVQYAEGAPAEPYTGEIYLRALQQLRGSEAALMARRAAQLFWSDAKVTRVWPCGECAAQLRLLREGN